jgi:hypothetical protein
LQFDCTAKQQKKTQSITFCFVGGFFFIWMRPFYFVSKRNSFWNDCMISFLFFLCFFFQILDYFVFDHFWPTSLFGGPMAERFCVCCCCCVVY